MNNNCLHPQDELTDRDIATLSRRARKFAGNPPGAEVVISSETYQDTTPWGARVQKSRMTVRLEFQAADHYPTRILFYAVRCSNCGRLILYYPDADAVCPYKGCELYAARLQR